MITLEQIKTLINGLKLIIPPFIKPDLGENDENSPHYVKGRTHWVDAKGTVHRLSEEFLPKDMPAAYQEHVDVEATRIANETIGAQLWNLTVGGSHGIDLDPSKTLQITNPTIGPINAVQVAYPRYPSTTNLVITKVFFPIDDFIFVAAPYASHQITAYLVAKYEDLNVVLKLKNELAFSQWCNNSYTVMGGFPLRTLEVEYTHPITGELCSGIVTNQFSTSVQLVYYAQGASPNLNRISVDGQTFDLYPGFNFASGWEIEIEGVARPIGLLRLERRTGVQNTVGYFGAPPSFTWRHALGEFVRTSDCLPHGHSLPYAALLLAESTGNPVLLRASQGQNLHAGDFFPYPILIDRPELYWQVDLEGSPHKVYLTAASKGEDDSWPYRVKEDSSLGWKLYFRSAPNSNGYIKIAIWLEIDAEYSAKQEKLYGVVVARTPPVLESLPLYTSDDNGKILRVVDGTPVWDAIPAAEDGVF